ncbi:MAG TPA: hypothetical protein VF177_13095 [Anaerolineae bacterium]
MMNWHDVEVEEKIAQERYRVIVEGRRVQKYAPAGPSIYEQFLNWIGNKMVRLGQRLQQDEVSQRQSLTGTC